VLEDIMQLAGLTTLSCSVSKLASEPCHRYGLNAESAARYGQKLMSAGIRNR
jgi:hypothetical protein